MSRKNQNKIIRAPSGNVIELRSLATEWLPVYRNNINSRDRLRGVSSKNRGSDGAEYIILLCSINRMLLTELNLMTLPIGAICFYYFYMSPRWGSQSIWVSHLLLTCRPHGAFINFK
jgi:hypothetical protein